MRQHADTLVDYTPVLPVNMSRSTLFFNESAGRAQKIWSGDEIVSVPDPKPTPAQITFSIVFSHTLYTASDTRAG